MLNVISLTFIIFNDVSYRYMTFQQLERVYCGLINEIINIVGLTYIRILNNNNLIYKPDTIILL